jgi:positive regulator of sigma E activity
MKNKILIIALMAQLIFTKHVALGQTRFTEICLLFGLLTPNKYSRKFADTSSKQRIDFDVEVEASHVAVFIYCRFEAIKYQNYV